MLPTKDKVIHLRGLSAFPSKGSWPCPLREKIFSLFLFKLITSCKFLPINTFHFAQLLSWELPSIRYVGWSQIHELLNKANLIFRFAQLSLKKKNYSSTIIIKPWDSLILTTLKRNPCFLLVTTLGHFISHELWQFHLPGTSSSG